MFKPLLDKKRKRKMRIFNTNSEEWKKALLEEIDADQLPACYGGSMTDPDGNPNCVTKVIYIHQTSNSIIVFNFPYFFL